MFGIDRNVALMWTFVVRRRRGFVRREDRAATQMKEKANSCELYRASSNDHTEAQDMTMPVPLHHARTFTPHVCMRGDASTSPALSVTLKFHCPFLIPPCVRVKFGKKLLNFRGEFIILTFMNSNSTLNMETVYW